MASLGLENFHSCTQRGGEPPASDGPGGEDRIALDNRSLWPNGSELTVNMWGASDFVRGKVVQYANEWTRYANLTFKFLPRDFQGDADIRVSFNKGGSWSYIGTSAKNIAQSNPTMNYGWFTDETSDEEFSRVIIHEFGHAIGCLHEQASPVSNIPWNKPVAYDFYQKLNGWSKEQVDSQVFAVAAQATTINSRFDRTSIMEYPYAKELTLDGSWADWNRHLSNLDKTFIMRCYPKDGIQRNTQDGVYFVNCFRGDEKSSGLAYYSHFGNNDGQQPDDYVDVTHGDLTWWENGGSATFASSGHTVTWNLAEDAGRSELYTRVGFADKLDEKWNVYRDSYRMLYERDGWQCFVLFWAF
ncbi:hypothetical protein BKA65DRAFT_415927 [Rhexocercosporidium sp. MPI-PUGE-AT-0058]|nr:hypothetical protein BKA65DRAFT_415927 [Rhexocercosporidium sp. MPI-PUGE-AT-0058]